MNKIFSFIPLEPGMAAPAVIKNGIPELWTEFCAQEWPAAVYACESCESTFDPAWNLVGRGMLPEWAAVMALKQTCGRGQLRRNWHSPEGNLYVSFRLPDSAIFKGESSSLLTGLLLCMAFECMGIKLLIKWPNDLVLVEKGIPVKVGGILLEERGGVLVAGFGLNLVKSPEKSALRENAALQAGTLSNDWSSFSAPAMWKTLVGRMILVYHESFKAAPESVLLPEAQKRLLWLGQNICIHENGGEAPQIGRFEGLSPGGGLRLRVAAENGTCEKVFFSGSLSAVNML